jgi:hypothetical protein
MRILGDNMNRNAARTYMIIIGAFSTVVASKGARLERIS